MFYCKRSYMAGNIWNNLMMDSACHVTEVRCHMTDVGCHVTPRDLCEMWSGGDCSHKLRSAQWKLTSNHIQWTNAGQITSVKAAWPDQSHLTKMSEQGHVTLWPIIKTPICDRIFSYYPSHYTISGS